MIGNSPEVFPNIGSQLQEKKIPFFLLWDHKIQILIIQKQ